MGQAQSFLGSPVLRHLVLETAPLLLEPAVARVNPVVAVFLGLSVCEATVEGVLLLLDSTCNKR